MILARTYNSTVYTTIHWNKTMGTGTFANGYYYSSSYYATFAFNINVASKTLAPMSNWYKVYYEGDKSSTIDYYVYYK